MINEEDIKRHLKYISQEAWRAEGNTSVNLMIEHIVREALFVVVKAIDEELKEKFAALDEDMLKIKETMAHAVLEQREWMSETALALLSTRTKPSKPKG